LPKEYRLLEFLMRHPNQVFSTESLFDRVWESDTMGSMDTVRGHIMRLRTKLDTAGRQSIISTVRRLGYKLNSR
jgi:DNA-binding response OmpR family regulator